jgi:murein L,D-transpeptidase YafK
MVWSKTIVFFALFFCMAIAKAKDLDSLLANYPRAMQAALNTEGFWQETFADYGMQFPPEKLFFRAFKQERVLEVWAAEAGPYQLIKSYEICMMPGKLGPKIRQGDKQVPEGIYFIDTLNPNSEFHLSMRVNYPNEADLIRSSAEKDPGGDIYIHGDCYSVGCLPMQDEPIEEIFWLVTMHQHWNPEQIIPVHIFPFRFSESNWSFHENTARQWQDFWQDLERIDAFFESNRFPGKTSVTSDGRYQLLD